MLDGILGAVKDVNKFSIRVGCTYKEVCQGRHNFAQILWLAAAETGMGWGGKVMLKLRVHARDMRLTRLYLESNDRSIGFYEKYGFQLKDPMTLPAGVWDLLERSDGRLMELQVDGWMRNRFDMVSLPPGYPETDEGDRLREALDRVRESGKADELKKKGYIYKESKGGGTPRIDKLNINDAVFQELKDNPILNKAHLTRLNSAKKKDQFLMDQNVLRGVGLRTPASNTRAKKGK